MKRNLRDRLAGLRCSKSGERKEIKMDENLRKAQLCLNDLLKLFKYICEQEGIQYFLLGGTTLGAVRHKGFIPWDDDIDVALYRSDYDRFINIGKKYLPKGISFQHYTLDTEYKDYTMKLVNEKITYVIERQNTQVKKHIWIDIFPIDGTPNTAFGKLIHYRKLDYHRMMLAFHYVTDVRIDPERSIVKRVLVKFAQLVPIGRLVDPSRRKRCLDREFRNYSVETSKFVGNYMGAYHEKEIFPKYYFGRGAVVQFEGDEYLAPAEVEKYLKQQYGDYMKLPPEDKRVPKHHILKIEFDE